MAEYKYGTMLQRGDVVVCGDGIIRTVIINQNGIITWTPGGRDGAQLLAHERSHFLPVEQIHHNSMAANMLVLASVE